ncbi:hypothetical protein Tco_0181767, partial [Tanacetum coccineum]
MKDASDPNDSEKGVAPDENLDGALVDAEMGNTLWQLMNCDHFCVCLLGPLLLSFDILKILDEWNYTRKHLLSEFEIVISKVCHGSAYFVPRILLSGPV